MNNPPKYYNIKNSTQNKESNYFNVETHEKNSVSKQML